MTHVTCRLTAENRNQLRNPTLDNRVWTTFTFSTFRASQHRRLRAYYNRRRFPKPKQLSLETQRRQTVDQRVGRSIWNLVRNTGISWTDDRARESMPWHRPTSGLELSSVNPSGPSTLFHSNSSNSRTQRNAEHGAQHKFSMLFLKRNFTSGITPKSLRNDANRHSDCI